MKESIDKNGNLILEINSKKIIINMSKLRSLTGPGILSISGCMKSLGGNIFDEGRTYIKRDRKAGSIYLNLRKIVNQKDKDSITQRKIVETLSHEVRHIFQPRSKSKFLKFCEKINIALSPFFAIICILEIIVIIIILKIGFKLPIYLDILLFFSPIFLIIMQVFYLLDPEEIDARRFSRKAVKNKKWMEVVQVKS